MDRNLMFRRREGRGSDRNNETRIVRNLTNNPITLGDIDNLEVPARKTRDLLKFASIQKIGNSVDLLTAVQLGLLQLKNRNNTIVNSNNIFDNIIPAVLEDTKIAEEATELTRNIRTVSQNYTAVADDDIILVSETATVTLPSAVLLEGYHFIVKNIGASATVTINTTGSETIDGISSKVITVQYNSLTFVSNGENWFVA